MRWRVAATEVNAQLEGTETAEVEGCATRTASQMWDETARATMGHTGLVILTSVVTGRFPEHAQTHSVNHGPVDDFLEKTVERGWTS